MNFKKIIFWLTTIVRILFWMFVFETTVWTASANAPSFENDYVSYLTTNKAEWTNWNERLWDMSTIGIDKNISIMENIKNIFYPDLSGQGGRLWDIIKILWLIVFIGMFVAQGLQYAMQADEESKIEWMHMKFLYIIIGWLFFFWATWLLGSALSDSSTGWSAEFLNRVDKWIIFQVFSGLRAWAFFIAIILMWVTGWRIMVSMDDEEKLTAGRQGILNILIALIIIKLIDYVYFIAQTPDLKTKATELIVEASKVLWYILWGFFTISLIYYGFRLMFSNGNEEGLEKIKNIITAVFLGSLVIFIFFLIVYQITQEFSG